NPNGVVFGESARVDAAGFLASTLDLHDDDFMAGRYAFSGAGGYAGEGAGALGGAIVNRGTLAAAPGGFVALLGNALQNDGEIVAPGGSVALAAGEKVSLYFDAS